MDEEKILKILMKGASDRFNRLEPWLQDNLRRGLARVADQTVEILGPEVMRRSASSRLKKD